MQQTADPGDAPGDITWMSYAELGRSRGISAASAKRLSNRRRWRKQAGNDGTTRVAVPAAEAVPRETVSGDVPGDISFYARALAVLEAALMEANKRADAAQVLAERTLAEFGDANTRAERAEKRAEDLLTRIDELKAGQELMTDMHARELAAARQDVLAVQEWAAELRQAQTERKARGLVARLRAALRGE
jgi:hypothetical protein